MIGQVGNSHSYIEVAKSHYEDGVSKLLPTGILIGVSFSDDILFGAYVSHFSMVSSMATTITPLLSVGFSKGKDLWCVIYWR